MSHSSPTASAVCPRCHEALAEGSVVCTVCGMVSDCGPSAGPNRGAMMPAGSLFDHLRKIVRGEFEVIRDLGRGGMAMVYLGRDVSLDRKVAIKVMLPDLHSNSGMAERFKREARTAAGLSHPHIIPIYSVREIDDLLFFVMKYVPGRSLETIVEEAGSLELSVVQTVLSQVGGALYFAHQKGIVHRDVKPANILIDENGWAVVTDFGIAKVAQTQGLTMTGGTVGTPMYMSPEQCVGGKITGASDQYSLGVVAYQMLSGVLPFAVDTVMSTMWAHVNEAPRPIEEVRPDCPDALSQAIMRMLEKHPSDRWPTIAHAVAAIGSVGADGEEPTRVRMKALATGEGQVVPAAGPRSGFTSRALASDEPKMADKVAVLTVTPPAGKLVVGEMLRLGATPKSQSGSLLPNRPVTWTSSVPTVAVVSSEGIVTGVSTGSATITGSCDGALDVCTVTVSSPPVASIRVTPPRVSLHMTETIQLDAQLADGNGTEIYDQQVTWMSSDPSVASVSATGLVRGLRAGNVLVAGTVEGKRGVAAVTVAPIPLAAILVTPREAVIGMGERIQLAANPVDERGMTLTDRQVVWSSSDESIVSVNEKGTVTGVAQGTADVTATCETKSASARVSVRRVPLAQLVATTPGGAMVVEQRIQLQVLPQDASGRILEDRTIHWSSSDASVVEVSDKGMAYAANAGSATITATCEGHEATIAIMVTRVGVASVQLSAPGRPLEVGKMLVLVVNTFDQFHKPLRKRFIQWASSNPEVARVSPTGKVTATSPGTAQITAACGNHSDSVEITVAPPKVSRLEIVPGQCSIPAGWQKQFEAVVQSATGSVIADVECVWSVSDPSIASVSADGLVTTHRPGSVMIAATAGNKRDTVRVIVTLQTE